ncbi:MAG: T9SS type A sorting domain-containing protein [Bacteroidota bacterium]
MYSTSRLFRGLSILLTFIGVSVQAQTVLLDDFNRANSTTVGNGWNETETVAGSGLQISTNRLVAASTTAGREVLWRDVSTNYNTVFATNTGTLTWMFNMRQSRSDPSGFDASNYGSAFVLGSNSSNFISGSNGYAVVFGNAGTADNVRLVRYSNGLGANANQISIIAPTVDYSSQYMSVKVTFNPVGSLWSLYIDTNSTGFVDPALTTFTQIGTTTADNTFTSSDLLFLGCLWNHATSSSDNAFFDNIYLPTACSPSSEPASAVTNFTATAVGANSIQLNWTRGNGSEVIVIAHQSGAVVSTPIDGASYAANTSFGSGTNLAPSEYVVYTGSGTAALITNLNPTTSYSFSIYEYNGVGCATNYLTSTFASANATTIGCLLATQPTIAPSGLTALAVQQNSIVLNWTRGNGAFCIVVCKAGSPVITPPADGFVYTANSSYGIGSSTGPAEYVVYAGTSNNVMVTGLMPATTYYFSVFEMNGTGCNTNYLVPASFASFGSTTAPLLPYSTFFGNLHSHSDYSDGDIDNLCGTFGASATCAFNIANTAVQFDFMGIADHNHNEGPVMTRTKFASGVQEAINYNTTHNDFVALYGMEWGTISTGGHATVYGINQLIGWNTGNYDVFVNKGDYATLFNLIAASPGAFSTLCHPNNTDYGNLLGSPYNATFDNAIIGTAVRNGDAFDSTYAYAFPPTTFSYITYYRTLLAKGYHLGPTADMDNHYSKSMGKANQGRTAVLASARNLSAITEGLLNMRFYATEDYNLSVTLNVNGTFPMGSVVAQNTDPVISVAASDGDGEAITSIKLYFGVPGSGTLPTILTSTTSGALNFTHAFASGTYYYYAEITQADGNMAWTSPIWYTKTTLPLPVELLAFNGEVTEQGNLLRWETASEVMNDHFELERGNDGIHFERIATLNGAGSTSQRSAYRHLDASPAPGTNYYRLKQVDVDGRFEYSPIVALRPLKGKNTFRIFPNPTTGTLFLEPETAEAEDYSIRIFDAYGSCVHTSFESGNSRRAIQLTGCSEGLYLMEIRSGDFVELKRFVVAAASR